MFVAFLGVSVDSGNRGVLALGSSLVGLTHHIAPGARIALLIGHTHAITLRFSVGDKTVPVDIIPCRLSPRSKLRDHLLWIFCAALLYRAIPSASFRRRLVSFTPWLATITEADLVADIRGGDSFSDIYGIKRFLYGFVLASVVILVRGHITQLPQTYGPYNSALAQRLARFLLQKSHPIIARDRASKAVADSLLEGRQRVLLSPDVAFSLVPREPRELRLEPHPDTLKCSVIGINVNGLMYNGGYSRNNMFGLRLNYPDFLPRMIRALLTEHTGEIWLIPHTFGPLHGVESDPAASRQVLAALPPEFRLRVRLLAGEYDQHELKAVIGRCTFFVGSRMHACIAAISQGVPCVGVAYSMKFRGVFETVGMEEWVVDGRNTDGAATIDLIVRRFRERDSVRSGLQEASARAKSQLHAVFDELFGSHRIRESHKSVTVTDLSIRR